MILAVPAKQLEDPLLERLAGALAGDIPPSRPSLDSIRPPGHTEPEWSIGVGRLQRIPAGGGGGN